MTTNNNTASASATVTFPLATLAVVFLIIAKLQDWWGLGDLSWWLVFAPYWLGLAVFFGILLIVGLFVGLGFLVVSAKDEIQRRKRLKK